ncbi:Kdo hydroxylase family protein [Legionella sp. 27cVA30]|uniref:Kdo hydroxylase family protein n=1 Tax=Legionella sp. 27cVA30 TaxID=2905657 RepID=UPI00209E115C|nr:Kdo hydroxylase family protein [Legionella sp. 27cVA30]MCP0913009.1 Kdo hydroxylase family protein [Legionella sp. 27cVA30]
MDERFYTLEINALSSIQHAMKQQAMQSLEAGKVVYFPHYAFIPTAGEQEQDILSESILDPKHKNISYDYCSQRLAGVSKQTSSTSPVMQKFMHRFAEFAHELVAHLLPQYQRDLIWGRTSYRPAEIRGRKSSKRKDDTRLHVDAFPSTPVNGLRIFRVFCNINPYGEPRVWHLGEPFRQVLNKFVATIPPFSATYSRLLKFIKATKTLRSPYDHYMLHLHDQMKLDDDYQQSTPKFRFDFPPYSTWLTFTDHVSHAALSGQFLLEQTFYLPVTAMQHPHLSPLQEWEQEKACSLV